MHWVEQQIWTRGAEKEKDTKRAKVTQRGENKDGHWRNSLGYDWILLPHFLRPLTSVSHIYSSLGLDSIDPATYFLPARTHTHTHTHALTHAQTNTKTECTLSFSLLAPCAHSSTELRDSAGLFRGAIPTQPFPSFLWLKTHARPHTHTHTGHSMCTHTPCDSPIKQLAQQWFRERGGCCNCEKKVLKTRLVTVNLTRRGRRRKQWLIRKHGARFCSGEGAARMH